MMNTMNTMNTMDLHKKEFTAYANKNEDNLYIAILAGLSFHDLRCMIIDEFEAELRVLLKEQKWSVIDDEYFKKEHTWSKGYWAKFRKSNWPERIYVGIEPNAHFSHHDYGVIANENEVTFDKEQFNRSDLIQHLKSILGSGRTDNHCVWESELKGDYANLNSAEGLMALSHFRRGNALTDLAGKINAVGDALDSFFSEVASRKQPNAMEKR
jgi:hypothetical protein